ncbi:hypothetical protein BKA67DRAFT_31377 [Truncatella angustata]|uniref:Cyclin N-terminal domain-containing protein n=1 Tax=Truncatella angustata TaxID=152316 RepID=A0A9P9A1R8_9PEZI|nr:uncharacterized protein BKA67DRAFT_31377 [Truncatella angustata]KAH6659866.1 hypothetical protein BKA67DRAFT_31377 [Truncatella angustata]KAH8195377.1 hypothetical protein TruAng_010458 [Truncatella angustata]
MGHNKSFSQNDGFEFDEACFRKFYRPLSNLPTPPPSSRTSSATQSPRIPAHDTTGRNDELLASAVHLTRMLPSGLSLEEPSVAVVQDMLSRANLPMDTIALAVCILDALPTRYRNRWRMVYPRTRQTPAALKRHTLPSGPIESPNDAVFPEVTILCAIMIATKFTEDAHDPTQYFCSEWGRDIWSCEQINATERCVMEVLDYRIMPLTADEYIKEARHDIEYTRRELLDETSDAAFEAKEHGIYDTRPMSSGEAVTGLGLQLTPAETPVSELSCPFGQNRLLARETKEAFGSPRALPENYLHLP